MDENLLLLTIIANDPACGVVLELKHIPRSRIGRRILSGYLDKNSGIIEDSLFDHIRPRKLYRRIRVFFVSISTVVHVYTSSIGGCLEDYSVYPIAGIVPIDFLSGSVLGEIDRYMFTWHSSDVSWKYVDMEYDSENNRWVQTDRVNCVSNLMPLPF